MPMMLKPRRQIQTRLGRGNLRRIYSWPRGRPGSAGAGRIRRDSRRSGTIYGIRDQAYLRRVARCGKARCRRVSAGSKNFFKTRHAKIAAKPDYTRFSRGSALKPDYTRFSQGGALKPDYARFSRGNALKPDYERFLRGNAEKPDGGRFPELSARNTIRKMI